MAVFRDIEELGRGGFGIVLKCVREPDGTRFAKKILLLDDAGSIKRFQREVRIIQRLKHKGIIKIVTTQLETAPYWYVMPLYDRSLLDVIPSLRGDIDRALRIFGAILEAIEHAHSSNVIHRDLKPENVLLDGEDSPIVTDFGLGRALDAMTSRATGTQAWIGTLGYMAPEQMYGAVDADVRSDIFALGRMLYEMLTGEPRLAVQDHMKLPIGLAGIVQKCTQTDPTQRFQTVAELRGTLERITQKHPQAAQLLQAVVERIASQHVFTSADIDELSRLIGLCREELDLLHQTAIKLPVAVFKELDERFPEISKLLAQQFAQCAIGKGWDFGYTDVIGDTCARLCAVTRQPEVKGILTAAALEVGVAHNRFHVMDIAAGLIAEAKDDADALAVAHAIQQLQYGAIEGRLTVWKLNPVLQELFSEQNSSTAD